MIYWFILQNISLTRATLQEQFIYYVVPNGQKLSWWWWWWRWWYLQTDACPSIGSSLGIQTECGHHHLAHVLVSGCWLSFLDSLPPTFLQKHRQNHHRSIEPNVETTLPWCNPLKTRSPPQLQRLLDFHIRKEPRSNSVPTSSSAASNVTTSCNRLPLWPADNRMDAGVENLLTTPMMAHSMALE